MSFPHPKEHKCHECKETNYRTKRIYLRHGKGWRKKAVRLCPICRRNLHGYWKYA